MSISASRLEEDLTCTVCRDIFRHPVALPCTHTFCKDCLRQWWAHKVIKECPVCKRISDVSEPPCVRKFANVCETFLREKRRKTEKRTAAAEEDTTMEEGGEGAAGETVNKSLQEQLAAFNDAKMNCGQASAHIRAQSLKAERVIKDQFRKLRQFLQEEEDARIAALREEEKQKIQRMDDKVEALSGKISTLKNAIRGFGRRPSVPRLNPPPPLNAGALIDEAKHLGNLAFAVWDKMKDLVSYTPVVLDPNTAYPWLALSDDLTAVSRGDRRQRGLPDNPERLDYYSCVLGSEGFDSGVHSWDVEVGENHCWSIGVLAESYPRKGDAGGRCWRIICLDGEYRATCRPSEFAVLRLKRRPRKVRVRLDWSGGTLSFSDPDANAHLHTFTQEFTEKVFPYIYSYDASAPLRLLPRTIRVDRSL